MTTSRRLLALALPVAMAGLLATTTSSPAASRSLDDRCVTRGPIRVEALPALSAAGCHLVGRMVTDGRVSAVVPPAGMSVAGDGVGRHGERRGLVLTNTGSSVRVAHPGDAALATARSTAGRAGSPPACKDRTFHLERTTGSGPKVDHPWKTPLRYAVNLAHKPHQLKQGPTIQQIKIANENMRRGRNTCHRPRLKTPVSHYLGRTHAKPSISPSGPSCGAFNKSNVVGFGNLPGELLGWTCYWYYSDGRMAGADIMIDNGRDLVTKLPASCQGEWDFEGTVTHEWGHAYGMAHTGSGHDNLTMQHELTPCSTYARTLGLGDWLGMNKLYGHRH
jgi:hypothetical protein